MKIKVYFYTLTDALGKKSWDCVSDLSNNICVGGYDVDGIYHQYDSYEGCHSYEWAKYHGFKMEMIEKKIDI
jgi:hypothetical protein